MAAEGQIMDNVKCDVCRSPDSDEGNDIVNCDGCGISIHQNCYGIATKPSGPWLCQPCSMSKKPDCILCPNKGGAMKSTQSGFTWAHMSCVLWIPEVGVKCPFRMGPINNLFSIPQSSWGLVCELCEENVGACIQCCKVGCNSAYHVTCAYQRGLKMVIHENWEYGPEFISYCLNHGRFLYNRL